MTTGHHRTRGITVTSNNGNAPATAPDSGAGVRPLLDSFIDPFMIFEPIFDEHGRVVGFRYVELNRASCEYAGVVREDLIGRRVLELYPGEQGSAMTRMYLAAFETGVPLMLDDVRLPFEAVNADRYADIRVLRVGDLLHFTMRDATRRHGAVAELVQSEARFRLLAENSSDVVYLRDFSGVVTWVSPSITEMLGWDPVELIGSTARDLVHPDDLTGVVDRGRRLTEGEVVGGELVRARRSDGTYRVMSVTARLLDEQCAGLAGVVIGLRDVDEVVR